MLSFIRYCSHGMESERGLEPILNPDWASGQAGIITLLHNIIITGDDQTRAWFAQYLKCMQQKVRLQSLPLVPLVPPPPPVPITSLSPCSLHLPLPLFPSPPPPLVPFTSPSPCSPQLTLPLFPSPPLPLVPLTSPSPCSPHLPPHPHPPLVSLTSPSPSPSPSPCSPHLTLTLPLLHACVLFSPS